MTSALKNMLSPSGAAGNGEKAFVVLALLLAAGAFMNLTAVHEVQVRAEGMPGMQILWVLVYAVTLAFCYRQRRQLFRALVAEWPLLLIVTFAVLSTFWSQVPEFTLRRAAALALSLVFGIYLGSRFSLAEQMRLLAWVCGMSVLFSLFFGLLKLGTSTTVSYDVPGWYGIFPQKNDLGRMMVLSALVFSFWRRLEPKHTGLARVGFLASAILTALSRSMAAVVMFAVMITLLPYLRWALRKKTPSLVGGVAFLLLAGVISVFYATNHLQMATGLLGKDPALTGRVPLWIFSAAMALRRPLLGYGYDGFWHWDSDGALRIWRLMPWIPLDAHNGFLELWLELGLVGAALFLAVFTLYLTRCLQFLRKSANPAAAWPLIFMVFLFFADLTQNCFFERNSIFFILYAAVAPVVQKGRYHA